MAASLLRLSIVSLFVVYICSRLEEKQRFEGYKVFRVFTKSPTDADVIRKLLENELQEQLDVWSENVDIGGMLTVDIMVPRHLVDFVSETFQDSGIKYSILIDDIQRLIDLEAESLRRSNKSRTKRSLEETNEIIPERPLYVKETVLGRYPRYHEMLVWMSRVAAHHPDIASLVDIGYSFEGRKLQLLKIGSRLHEDKPAIWVDGGTHGREWIAPATALFIIDQLVSNYDKKRDIKELVDIYDWYIMPVLNPDGYEFSHSSNRLWRKTRSFTSGSNCRGVDANRNFGYKWKECERRSYGGRQCYSDNPCESIYAGPRPFSEKETRAKRDFLLSIKRNVKIVFSLHCYSQLWLTPWAYTKTQPENYKRLLTVARAGIRAIRLKHNRVYNVGSPARLLYAAGGSALDWTWGTLKAEYVYTLELPDQGQLGFLLPVEAIYPVADETFEGIKAVAHLTSPEFKTTATLKPNNGPLHGSNSGRITGPNDSIGDLSNSKGKGINADSTNDPNGYRVVDSSLNEINSENVNVNALPNESPLVEGLEEIFSPNQMSSNEVTEDVAENNAVATRPPVAAGQIIEAIEHDLNSIKDTNSRSNNASSRARFDALESNMAIVSDMAAAHRPPPYEASVESRNSSVPTDAQETATKFNESAVSDTETISTTEIEDFEVIHH